MINKIPAKIDSHAMQMSFTPVASPKWTGKWIIFNEIRKIETKLCLLFNEKWKSIQNYPVSIYLGFDPKMSWISKTYYGSNYIRHPVEIPSLGFALANSRFSEKQVLICACILVNCCYIKFYSICAGLNVLWWQMKSAVFLRHSINAHQHTNKRIKYTHKYQLKWSTFPNKIKKSFEEGKRKLILCI